ncbi:MAG: nitroreductase family protein [Clostridium argentinense]|uniref:Nitroreductase family protein n=1 Tax=Clostridium faecium TaxID=2762223 RepID=A0ABR8YUF9_9CLOT|nr:nitroreductase family protein [Clostridium faecium]MBD8047875.1 nitroreductase family protein [Clostridium faecium]MBS5823372.1 nitroreductase family protein [Clostridium argentinense]MDU1349390.1 nitroreductase family protein [Clostridium argentinense]
MNEILKTIRNRRSTRSFLPEQIKESELNAILEAGIYAPSATNKQPWYFTVVQNKDLIDRLNYSFKEFAKKSDNAYIRKFGNNDKFHVFYNSPTVILVSGEISNKYASIDCAAAVENMLIATESLGMGSCWIGLIEYLLNSEDGKEFVDELKIPEGFRQIHAIALGYKNNNLVNTPERRENTITYIK